MLRKSISSTLVAHNIKPLLKVMRDYNFIHVRWKDGSNGEQELSVRDELLGISDGR